VELHTLLEWFLFVATFQQEITLLHKIRPITSRCHSHQARNVRHALVQHAQQQEFVMQALLRSDVRIKNHQFVSTTLIINHAPTMWGQ
jgi:hypothetical protein